MSLNSGPGGNPQDSSIVMARTLGPANNVMRRILHVGCDSGGAATLMQKSMEGL
jgi:hypothetical protein